MNRKSKHIIITILSLMALVISIIAIKVFANGEMGTMTKINNDIGIMHTWPDGSPRHDAAYCLAGENACREGDQLQCVADLVFRNDGVMLNGRRTNPLW